MAQSLAASGLATRLLANWVREERRVAEELARRGTPLPGIDAATELVLVAERSRPVSLVAVQRDRRLNSHNPACRNVRSKKAGASQ